MTDTGVFSLADALSKNNTLKTLHIYGNDALTENGLTCLVEVILKNSSGGAVSPKTLIQYKPHSVLHHHIMKRCQDCTTNEYMDKQA